MTALVTFLAVVVWLAGSGFAVHLASIAWPFLVFLLWAAVSLTWYTPTIPGLENLVVVAAFLILLVMSSERASSSPDLAAYSGRALGRVTLVTATLYLFSVLVGGPGSQSLFASSTFSLFCLLGFGWFLAGWRHGAKRNALLTLFVGAVIVLALSRIAIVIALGLVPLAWFHPSRVRGWVRLAAATVVVAGLMGAGITYVSTIRERFIGGPPNFRLGSLTVNGNGRTVFWRVTWDSFLESPWIGQGAGSAQQLITSYHFRTAKGDQGSINHPHNDYLRILHDYGIVGLTLWLLGMLKLLKRISWAWVDADRRRSMRAHVHLGALLALVALSMAMITDNPWVYITVMGPVGILAGSSVGLAAANNREWLSASEDSIAGDRLWRRTPAALDEKDRV